MVKHQERTRVFLPKPPHGYGEPCPEFMVLLETSVDLQMNGGYYSGTEWSKKDDDREQIARIYRGIQSWHRNGMNTIYPSGGTVELLKNTSILDSVLCEDIKPVLPVMMVRLPQTHGIGERSLGAGVVILS